MRPRPTEGVREPTSPAAKRRAASGAASSKGEEWSSNPRDAVLRRAPQRKSARRGGPSNSPSRPIPSAAALGPRNRGSRPEPIVEPMASGEPERLQKALAHAGAGSRRSIETLISEGRITINGRIAKLGDRVRADDRVLVDSRPVKLRSGMDEPRVLMYHKPAGEIVSRDDPEGRPSVFARLPPLLGGRWLAIGRLDFNTSGLLLLTSSGELAQRMSHPSNEIEREYAVRVLGELADEALSRLRKGVQLEDGPARFDLVEPAGGEGTNRWYRVILREGRNREVRRMFEAVGLTVSRLMRVRFGPFQLPPRLRQGHWDEIPAPALARLLSALDKPAKFRRRR